MNKKPDQLRLFKNGKIWAVGKKVYGGPPLQLNKLTGPKVSSNSHSAPVATGSQYRGAQIAEREHLDGKRGRVVQIVGHQFLDAVSAPETGTWTLGDRTNVVILSPDALGGRMQLLAEQFEQHKVNKMRVVYRPTVPSTTAGAVAIYFRNDVGTPGLDLGVDEMNHASTHPSFIQTQVWEEASVEIDPSDALKKYFDEETGDFRLEVQGILTVIAASDLPALTDVVTYGNLFLEYDIEFYGEELDYEVPDITTGVLEVLYNLNDENMALTPFEAVGGDLGAPPGPAPIATWSFTGDLSTTEQLLYGVVEMVNDAAMVPSGNAITLCTLEDPTPVPVTVGQSFYIRMINGVPGSFNVGDGSIRMLFFSDLAAASGPMDYQNEGSDLEPASNPGQMILTGQNHQTAPPPAGAGPDAPAVEAPITGGFRMFLRAMPLSNQ